MTLLAGFLLVVSLGVFHHVCLRQLDHLRGRYRRWPNWTVIGVFIGLLAVHTVEILGFAAAYRILLDQYAIGTIGGGAPLGWTDLVYFSGINFVTLGYTQLEADGPLRLINMMQSLGGFMVLTWSATFIYAVWRKAFD